MLRAGLRRRSQCCGRLWRSPCPEAAGGSARALSAAPASPSAGSGGGARSGGAPPAGASTVKPLDGVKILDLTRVLAGPFATMNLGDLGAEVIKVERPGAGDDTRAWGPPFAGTESVYFLSVNRNKKSIAINMKDSKGVKLIKELAAASDVFVENFVPGKLAEMGLGYEDIKKIAPHIVYCSITGSKDPVPAACPFEGYVPVPYSSPLTSNELTPGAPCHSFAEEPRTGHSTPDVASPGLSRGAGLPPPTCWPCSS